MNCNQYPGLRWWVRVSCVEFGAMGQYHLAASLARALGITNWTIIADNNNSMQYHNAHNNNKTHQHNLLSCSGDP